MYHQRKDNYGNLEILCLFKKNPIPIWKKVTEVRDCVLYTAFLKKYEEEKAEKQAGREREEKLEEGDEFSVEKFLCIHNEEVLVLWEFWDDPTWEPIHNFVGNSSFEDWKESSEFFEIEDVIEE